MTHVSTAQRWTMGIARLTLLAAAAIFFLSGAGTTHEDTARALTDQAGAVTFVIDRTADGTGATVHVEAADGVLIYDVQAHLCIHDSGVRTFFDFGWSGKKCTNASVGGSDVEQRVRFPDGVAAADLPVFHLGQGTVRWFNADNYDQEISCLPGAPCDLVVLAQITKGEAIYSAELCFDAVCPAGTVGGPDPNAPPPAPPTAEPPADAAPAADPAATAAPDGSAAAAAAAGGSKATGASSSKKDASSSAKSAEVAAGKSASSSNVDPEAEPRASTISVATPSGSLARSTRVRAAAVAGLAGGVLIAGLIGRGRRMVTEVDG